MNNVYINPTDNYGKAILEQNKIEFEAQMKEIISNKINTMQEKIKNQKKLLKEKDEEIEKLNYIIDKQDRDIVALSNGNRKLNNIINELEKWLNEEINNNVDGIKSFGGYQCKRTLDKLNELKGSDKE